MENRFSADKKLEDLSIEDFSCVLKQVADHSLPEKEKYPLVQKLQADAQTSSDNIPFSSLVQSFGGGGVRNGNNRSTAKLRSRLHILSKDNEFQSSHQSHRQSSHCQYKQVNNAQSLQELSTNNCDDNSSSHNLALHSNISATVYAAATSNHAATTVASNRKPNRANSFTMPSLSDNSDTINNQNRHDQLLTNGEADDGDIVNNETMIKEPQMTSTMFSKITSQALDNSSHLHSSDNTATGEEGAGAGSSGNAGIGGGATGDGDGCCGGGGGGGGSDTKQSTKNQSSGQANSILSNMSLLVNSVHTDLPNKYQGILSSTSTVSTSSSPVSAVVCATSSSSTTTTTFSPSDNKGFNKTNSESLAVEEEDDDKPCFGEVKEQQRKAEYFEFHGSDLNVNNTTATAAGAKCSRNSVGKMTNSKSEEYASRNNVNHSNLSTYSQSSSSITNPAMTAANIAKKAGKKKKEEEFKLAGEIEGNIGYLDVSTLEKFVNETSTSTVVANGVDKKNKGKTQKHDNGGGNGASSVSGNNNTTVGGAESKRTNKSDKRNNGDNNNGKPLFDDSRSGTFNSTATTKKPLNSVSNSSSLSGDEISLSKDSNDNNTSPELTSSNGIKSKKSKAKRKQEKNNKTSTNRNSSGSQEADGGKSNQCDTEYTDDKSRAQTKSQSSSDDFDPSDAEIDGDDPLVAFYSRSKKSNSLLPTKTESLVEDERFYTVSDSEMTDQGFTKYEVKKKKRGQRKILQSGFGGHGVYHQQQHHSSSHKPHNNSNTNNPNYQNSKDFHNKSLHSGSICSNSLGRGYESERECSQNNCTNPNSFASQSLSTSMLAIDSKSNEPAKITAAVPPVSSTTVNSYENDNEMHFISNNTDCDLPLINAASRELADNSPKIPSYADIAKSHGKLSQMVETSVIIEEFPQLETQSHVESVDIVAECAKPLTAAAAAAVAVAATATSTSTAAVATTVSTNSSSGTNNNGIPNDTTPTTAIATADVDNSANINDETILSVNDQQEELSSHSSINTALMNTDHVIEQPSLPPPPSATMVEESVRFGVSPVHADSQQAKSSPNNSSPAVVFVDEYPLPASTTATTNTTICPLMFGEESPILNGVISKQSSLINGSKLVFGFFDVSEVSLLQDSNYSPFELTAESSTDSGVNIMKNIEYEENPCNNVNFEQINELQMCENANLEANFFKKAVHVNVLEEHFRKNSDNTTTATSSEQKCQNNNPREGKKQTLSSTASSPLFSSFDSSPISSSSTAVSSSSIQSNPTGATIVTANIAAAAAAAPPGNTQSFVSCLNKYRSIRMVDKANVITSNTIYKSLLKYLLEGYLAATTNANLIRVDSFNCDVLNQLPTTEETI